MRERKYPVEIIVSIERPERNQTFRKRQPDCGKTFHGKSIHFFRRVQGNCILKMSAASQLNVIHAGTGDIVLKGKDLG